MRPLRELVTPGRHVAIVGVTASGKSALAMALARAHEEVEIVSVDSMQVYRGMDIGTAKPTEAERAEVAHHMIDLVEPSEDFTMARFAEELRGVLADIDGRGKRAVLVGGTGLYVRAALDDLDVPGQFPDARAALEADPDTLGLHRRLHELDPVAAARMEPTNRRRVVRALEVCLGSGRPFSSFGPGLAEYAEGPVRLIGLRRPRPEIDRRIAARYDEQLRRGLLDEVRALHERPDPVSRTAGQALGYKELLAHVRKDSTLEAALELAVIRTRQFARKQERWFRRDPRIVWFDASDPAVDARDLAADPSADGGADLVRSVHEVLAW